MRRFAFLLAGIVLVMTNATNAWADNVVSRWVDQALNTVRVGNISTPAAARLYAMTTVSMYDAVNGIDRGRHRSKREYALVPPDGAPIAGNRRAAAAAAAHAVLIALLPSHASVLDGVLAKELATLGGEGAPPVALGGVTLSESRSSPCGLTTAPRLPKRYLPGPGQASFGCRLRGHSFAV
ncbi:MAG: hypothetical protein ACREXS_15320 [Gammaproteobacteria bacterium]